MPKLNICAARLPGMGHAEYSRYLMDNHARLVLSTEAVSRYLQAYVQQHVYDACYGAEAPAWRYDSVSHISTASAEDLKAATATAEYRELVAPDEARFADQRSPMFLIFEETPLPLPLRGASRLRLLHYLRARPGVAVDNLHAGWAAAHEALLFAAPRLFEGVRRATLNRTLTPPNADAPPYAGMCELGFLQHTDEAAVAEYVRRIEDELAPLIQRDAGFHLLAEAVPVRGSLY